MTKWFQLIWIFNQSTSSIIMDSHLVNVDHYQTKIKENLMSLPIGIGYMNFFLNVEHYIIKLSFSYVAWSVLLICIISFLADSDSLATLELASMLCSISDDTELGMFNRLISNSS